MLLAIACSGRQSHMYEILRIPMLLVRSKKLLPIAILGAVIIAVAVIFINAPSENLGNSALDSLTQPTMNTATDTATFRPNLSAVIHESLLNDLLEATGYLKGEGPLLFKSKSSNFAWKAEQLHVQITDSGAVFTANVFVHWLGMNYQAPVQGTGIVAYDYDKEQINLVLKDVPFDFRFKILGKRIKILTMNVADVIGPTIGILGDIPLQLDFDVKKLDGKKPLKLTVKHHSVRYEPERVIVDFEVDFSENGEIGTNNQADSSVIFPAHIEQNIE
ncbi:MAG: hypothetical protein IPP40_11430 [bacterium]|nr:hypothetical protein [bacterium]